MRTRIPHIQMYALDAGPGLTSPLYGAFTLATTSHPSCLDSQPHSQYYSCITLASLHTPYQLYVIGHGRSSQHPPVSWMQGSALYMARHTTNPIPNART